MAKNAERHKEISEIDVSKVKDQGGDLIIFNLDSKDLEPPGQVYL